MVKKFCLVILLLLIPTSFTLAQDFFCKGFYDIYDDTCYFKGGAFLFFGFQNGSRQVVKNGKSVRYFFYFGGDPYFYSRFRWWKL
jgi:hypothetical protein